MKLLVLDGSTRGDPLVQHCAQAIAAEGRARGASVEHRALAELQVTWCQGCFECWTHSPGICRIDDVGRALSDAYATSDAAVLVCRSAFGGLGGETKKAVDRFLGTLLPFFRRIEGEVHHSPRYPRPKALGLVAVPGPLHRQTPNPDFESEVKTLLEVLLVRNALNVAASRHHLELVRREDEAEDAAQRTLQALLFGPEGPAAVVPPDLWLPPRPTTAGAPPKRALLLIGSAKPKGSSTSEVLGGELLHRLEAAGVEGETRYVARDGHSNEGRARIAAAAQAADILILASPIYFDGFPALLGSTLEHLIEDPSRKPSAVAAVVNCGFPEAHHGHPALAQAHLFAKAVGADWRGGLALGGGGVIAGRSLSAVGGVAAHLAPALDEAAAALSSGHAIPASAVKAFARPMMPKLAYMAAGDAGWLWTAAHQGTLLRLWARPADSKTTTDH